MLGSLKELRFLQHRHLLMQVSNKAAELLMQSMGDEVCCGVL